MKQFMGKRALVFKVIRDAYPTDFEGWVSLSYQDITDRLGCMLIGSVKYTCREMLRANFLQRKNLGKGYTNQWRVNPNLREAIEKLNEEMNKNEFI